MYAQARASEGDARADAALMTGGWALDDYEDGASYVDAATVALKYSFLRLGSEDVGGPTIAVPVTPRSLRDAMGCLVTGVCVVTTVLDGHDVAMTANSVTSVSLDPPLILFCVTNGSTFENAVLQANCWGVSVLDAASFELSSHFARPGRRTDGQFERVGHHRGLVTGVALLDTSVAEVECMTESTHAGGDHTIVVGRVVSLFRRGEGTHPLLFHRGRYRWLL